MSGYCMSLNETTDPLGAMALLLGMLWNPQHEEPQWQAIEVAGIKGLDDLVRRWCEPLRTQTPSENLIIIERSIPALRGLSPEQYRVFRNLLETWIDADGKTVLQEWCLFHLISKNLISFQVLAISSIKHCLKQISASKTKCENNDSKMPTMATMTLISSCGILPCITYPSSVCYTFDVHFK